MIARFLLPLALLVLTATATIAFDLIVAVELGIALAALFALRAVARAIVPSFELRPHYP